MPATTTTVLVVSHTTDSIRKSEAPSAIKNHPPDVATDQASTDSGYGSNTTTPNSTPRDPLPKRHSSYPFKSLFHGSIKKYPVPAPDVEIDQATRERFATIQPHFERLLLEHVRSGQKAGAQYKPMATRIMVMETRKGDKIPHVVVFCQPRQKTLVRSFAKQDAVKDICQPGDPGVPSFEIAIIGVAPRLRATDIGVIRAIAEAASDTPAATLCGLPITVELVSGEKRNTTLGGVIKVVMGPGDIKLYGLTVGHVLQSRDQDEDDEVETVDDDDHDSDDDEGTTFCWTPEQTQQDSGDDVPLEKNTTPIVTNLSTTESNWSFTHPEVIGTLSHSPSALANEDAVSKPDYDWALFEMSSYKANIMMGDSKARISLSNKTPGTTGRRSVYLLGASSGLKSARLLQEPGRILLGAGEGLVDTHMLVTDEEDGIRDGDSGCWVVDRDTFELYGHLVATDPFNGGYVVPMYDILNDIKRQLGAATVELPDTPDFLHDQRYHDKVATPLAAWDGEYFAFSPDGMALLMIDASAHELHGTHPVAAAEPTRIRRTSTNQKKGLGEHVVKIRELPSPHPADSGYHSMNPSTTSSGPSSPDHGPTLVQLTPAGMVFSRTVVDTHEEDEATEAEPRPKRGWAQKLKAKLGFKALLKRKKEDTGDH